MTSDTEMAGLLAPTLCLSVSQSSDIGHLVSPRREGSSEVTYAARRIYLDSMPPPEENDLIKNEEPLTVSVVPKTAQKPTNHTAVKKTVKSHKGAPHHGPKTDKSTAKNSLPKDGRMPAEIQMTKKPILSAAQTSHKPKTRHQNQR